MSVELALVSYTPSVPFQCLNSPLSSPQLGENRSNLCTCFNFQFNAQSLNETIKLKQTIHNLETRCCRPLTANNVRFLEEPYLETLAAAEEPTPRALLHEHYIHARRRQKMLCKRDTHQKIFSLSTCRFCRIHDNELIKMSAYDIRLVAECE